MGGQAGKQGGANKQMGFGPGPGGPNSNPWASPGQGMGGGFAAGPPRLGTSGEGPGGRMGFGGPPPGFGGGMGGVRTMEFRPEDQARMEMENSANQQKQAQIEALRGGGMGGRLGFNAGVESPQMGQGAPQMPEALPEQAAPQAQANFAAPRAASRMGGDRNAIMQQRASMRRGRMP